jgi:hypothetical protein
MLLLMMMILLARLAGYCVYLSQILDCVCVCVERERERDGGGLEFERDSTFMRGKSLSLLYSAGIDIWWQCYLLYWADHTALLSPRRYHFITLEPSVLLLATGSSVTGLLGPSLTLLCPCDQAPRHEGVQIRVV